MPPGVIFLAFLLGLLFLGTGGLKLMVPHEQARLRIGWVDYLSDSSYRAAGWFELAGGIGLMFPTMVQAVEWLTPLSATGLGLEMVVASLFHSRRREWRQAVMTLVLVVGLFVVAANSME